MNTDLGEFRDIANTFSELFILLGIHNLEYNFLQISTLTLFFTDCLGHYCGYPPSDDSEDVHSSGRNS